ncbi:phosphatase PAP2 family protein [Streptomyces sp. 061-3]|uniref:phosphatase PAP2 family protein n=1 Tax=Streptomyces sp. 061-3 TaxID=2789268 RepID=UPI00398095D5
MRAPLAAAVTHVAGELLKSIADDERPYRPVVAAAASPAPCPPTDHWSFPGNHPATAGATAVVLAFPRPRTAWCTVPPTLLMAFSRVFAGVRLPRDVAVGLLAEGSVAAPVIVLLSRPARSLTLTARNQPGAPRGPDTGPWSGRPSPRRARMRTPVEAHCGDRRVALSLHGPP